MYAYCKQQTSRLVDFNVDQSIMGNLVFSKKTKKIIEHFFLCICESIVTNVIP